MIYAFLDAAREAALQDSALKMVETMRGCQGMP